MIIIQIKNKNKQKKQGFTLSLKDIYFENLQEKEVKLTPQLFQGYYNLDLHMRLVDHFPKTKKEYKILKKQ